ncbi:hypothetical protein G9A89_005744 [Geosiphon pyriformis]|nr:hypothetical protein G9A89_005744 [Geosiphon pyriformis]
MHPADLPTAVIHARNFEATELKTNHAQAVNLVMNESSELDFKLKQFTIQKTTIVPKIKHVPQHWPISSGSQRRMSVTTVVNKGTSEQTATLITICDWEINIEIPITNFKLQDINKIKNNINPLTCHISNPDLLTTATSNISTTAANNISTTATNHLLTPTNLNTTPEPSSNNIRQLSIQSHSKLEIGDGCLPTGLQFIKSTIRIMLIEFRYWSCPKPKFPTLFKSPATIFNNESLAAIFPFELKETTLVLLFSGATLKKKSITVIYMDARIDGHPIKLILDSGSAGSIITKQLMDQLGRRVDRAVSARIITADEVTKTPISKIDNFPFKVNGIVTSIKVLVIEAT